MKNYTQKGRTLDLTAAADRKSGDIVRVGALLGVAVDDAKAGEKGPVSVKGVYLLSKADADAFTEGETCGLNADTQKIEKDGTDAVVISAAGEGSTSAEVWIG